jgi:hypothetical protein
VQRNTPQGETIGKVKKKLTSSKKIKHHLAKASKEKENPEYLVQSQKSGKKAAVGRASFVKSRSDLVTERPALGAKRSRAQLKSWAGQCSRHVETAVHYLS